MNRCLITYNICGENLFSEKGLRLLSPSLKKLAILDYSAKQLREEAMLRATRISIQGVQPKLSAVLNIKKGIFEIVDRKGRFILKPQHHVFPELPENEDLTMRMAARIGIEIPLHGLLPSKDGSLTYFIKRFDRKGQKDKLAVEDFAQLAGKTRDTKYSYSMESLVKLIDKYCTFPAVEKVKLFKLVIFNFLVGNEDMHLKNYSIIIRNNLVAFSPVYDLLNTTIVLKGDVEEIALSLKGKKKNLNYDVLINYFGKDRCGLSDILINQTTSAIQAAFPDWYNLIGISFLSDDLKDKYMNLLLKRKAILGF